MKCLTFTKACRLIFADKNEVRVSETEVECLCMLVPCEDLLKLNKALHFVGFWNQPSFLVFFAKEQVCFTARIVNCSGVSGQIFRERTSVIIGMKPDPKKTFGVPHKFKTSFHCPRHTITQTACE